MSNTVVLVTGALTGIGRATALAFAREGSHVVVSGRREKEGEALAAELRRLEAQAEFVRADVRLEEDVRRLVERTVQRFGRLDIAVNNAGTEGALGPIAEQTPDAYSATFETNVLGTLLSLKHELRVMLKQGTGSIVNLSSVAGHVGMPGASIYVASKHAIEGLTKTAALEAAAGGVATLRLIIKADQGGPAEALADALAQLSTAEVKVEVVHRGVGAITESDVLLARASGAIIVGFHVRPDSNARAAADRERVEIRTYRIIYEAVEEVKLAMEGLLAPEKKEVVLGEAEVRQIFKIAKIGTIAGCFVRSGVIPRTGRVRVIRNGVEVYDGTLASLKRFKDDVREVREGFECGIGIENFNDVKVGDLIESYRIEEVARSLSAAES